MPTKTILIITDNCRDQINGVVTTFSNIEKYAVADGYNVVYIDPGQFYHIDAPGYPEVKLSWPWRIGKKIKEINPDHIHIATEGPLGLAANLWCWRHNYKFNTSYHTKFPEFLKKMYGLPEWITYRYVSWFHNHSGKVLTTTKTMVEELQQHRFRKDIIPWTRGVDRSIFKSSLRQPRDNNGPVLLNVGRVSKEKNLDAFCSLDYTGATKIVVGDGPYRKELEKRYPDIQFVGTKIGEDLARYYANADVFVFPSKADTFGVVIIEALACGTPVVGYDVPGPKDIIEPGITGYIGPNLKNNIKQALQLSRERIEIHSHLWSWKKCWKIFKDNLVDLT
jgi:glycosyltransferase involved in cell wall biosynthesis